MGSRKPHVYERLKRGFAIEKTPQQEQHLGRQSPKYHKRRQQPTTTTTITATTDLWQSEATSSKRALPDFSTVRVCSSLELRLDVCKVRTLASYTRNMIANKNDNMRGNNGLDTRLKEQIKAHHTNRAQKQQHHHHHPQQIRQRPNVTGARLFSDLCER